MRIFFSTIFAHICGNKTKQKKAISNFLNIINRRMRFEIWIKKKKEEKNQKESKRIVISEEQSNFAKNQIQSSNFMEKKKIQ